MNKLICLGIILFSYQLFGISLVDELHLSITNNDVLLPLLLSFCAGLLTSLSPCVYPLIPITLSIMGARRYESQMQGFLIALVYVLGMTLLYAVLGVLFASLGMLLGSFMQHPLALISIAIFFLILALSMLNVWEFSLPAQFMKRVSSVGGQGFRGAFLMGLVAGLLAAPCTGPVLGFILTLITNMENIWFGFMLMLSFSFGMGLPFLVLGTFSSALTRLPKSGAWMDNIKYIFAAIMMSASLYYLALAFPLVSQMLATIKKIGWPLLVLLLLVGTSLILLAGRRFSALRRVMGTLFFALAVATMLTWETSKPSTTETLVGDLSWHIIDRHSSEQTLENLMLEAKNNRQPMMLDFYADWCIACKQLDLATFRHKNIAPLLNNFYLVRIDSTQSSDYLSKLQNRFNVTGLPTVIFIKRDGTVVPGRVLGYLPPEQFIKTLDDSLD